MSKNNTNDNEVDTGWLLNKIDSLEQSVQLITVRFEILLRMSFCGVIPNLNNFLTASEEYPKLLKEVAKIKKAKSVDEKINILQEFNMVTAKLLYIFVDDTDILSIYEAVGFIPEEAFAKIAPLKMSAHCHKSFQKLLKK